MRYAFDASKYFSGELLFVGLIKMPVRDKFVNFCVLYS